MTPYNIIISSNTYLFRDPFSKIQVERIEHEYACTVINECGDYLLLAEFNLWINKVNPTKCVKMCEGKYIETNGLSYVVHSVIGDKVCLSLDGETVALIKKINEL